MKAPFFQGNTATNFKIGDDGTILFHPWISKPVYEIPSLEKAKSVFQMMRIMDGFFFVWVGLVMGLSHTVVAVGLVVLYGLLYFAIIQRLTKNFVCRIDIVAENTQPKLKPLPFFLLLAAFIVGGVICVVLLIQNGLNMNDNTIIYGSLALVCGIMIWCSTARFLKMCHEPDMVAPLDTEATYALRLELIRSIPLPLSVLRLLFFLSVGGFLMWGMFLLESDLTMNGLLSLLFALACVGCCIFAATEALQRIILKRSRNLSLPMLREKAFIQKTKQIFIIVCSVNAVFACYLVHLAYQNRLFLDQLLISR